MNTWSYVVNSLKSVTYDVERGKVFTSLRERGYRGIEPGAKGLLRCHDLGDDAMHAVLQWWPHIMVKYEVTKT